MPEWLFEDGIGERRAALVEGSDIVEARVERDGAGPLVGTIIEARIIETVVPRLSALVALDDGREAMLDNIPSGMSEGRTFLVQIVREPLLEQGRSKRAKAIPAPPGAIPVTGPDLRARIAATGHPVRQCFAHETDALEAAGWSEVLDEAERGEIAFDGGALRMTIAPAMTLFDVDGSLPAGPLAEAAAKAVCAAIFRHSIGGSIGIDFPTLPDRAARRAVDAIIDGALPQPFERTAINGFGFLQIVRRRPRASLPERLRADPVLTALLASLRRLERDPPGDGIARLPHAQAERLRGNPQWLAELIRRTGKTIAIGT